jgi:carbonic anhydrase/acetyltransferase-like protein (isoleucine patch superfamily)
MPVYRLADADVEVPESGNYWIAPTAVVIGRVVLKENASVWWGAVLRGDNDPIVVGENSNIQDLSMLHTDIGAPLTIGANVTVGHQVMLHGCTVEDGALIGIQSCVLNHAVIGAGALVGAKALVPERKTIAPRMMALGAPAVEAKELSEQQSQRLVLSALHYVENWKRLKRELGPSAVS